VIRRRRSKAPDGLAQLVTDAQELVGKLVAENRSLRAQNKRLTREVDRLSEGWEQVKKLARQAPRSRRRR
jgi:cell division protein FtsB